MVVDFSEKYFWFYLRLLSLFENLSEKNVTTIDELLMKRKKLHVNRSTVNSMIIHAEKTARGVSL